MRRGIRVDILCEDRRQEQFLTGLCKLHDIQIIHVQVAPRGRGAASGWVRSQYPALIRAWRALAGQPNRGVLVAIDGDTVGVVQRKRSLDQALAERDLAPRGEAERAAILVPTWSLETWLLFLHDGTVVPESVASKQHPKMARLAPATGNVYGELMRRLLLRWQQGAASPLLASLADGRLEFDRVLSHV